MKRVLLFLFWSIGVIDNVYGQNWAGPDTMTCGELGVVIGSNDPCLGCCYFWSPTIGLSDHKIKNPTAKPTTETVYSVTVTDSNLRLKGTDQVAVGLSFGEMRFSPDYLVQGSEESEVHASLLKLGDVDQPSEIAWDIFGPTLNCEYTPQGLGAIYTSGNLYGEITVEARKVSVPGCFVREALPVNNGVKDVWAIDTNQMTRIAKTGETLYVINDDAVLIHAIPNPGGFQEGIPDWKPDTYGSNTPMDGDDYFQISEDINLSDIISDYIAGDEPDFKPKVTVVRKPSQPTDETTLTSPWVEELLEGLTDLIRFKDQPAIDPPCGPLYPFDMSFTVPTFKLTEQVVEKYNTPRLSRKKELVVDAELAASGRLFHPVFTKSFTSKYFNVALCSRLFIEVTASASANIKVVKDPSLPDSTYQPVSPEFVLGLSIGGGAQFAFQPVNYLLIANAKIGTSAKITFSYKDQKLQAVLKINPAVTKVEAKIQAIGNMGQFEDLSWGVGNFSKELELIPAREFSPYIIYDFQN